MGRSGYTYDDDDGMLALYRGQVASALRGRRGQAFLRDLVAALDAMPDKGLIAGDLVVEEVPCDLVRWLFAPSPVDGEHPWYRKSGIEWPHECGVCALGALGLKRGVDMSKMDPDDAETIGAAFNIADQLAREVVWENDENSWVWVAAERRERPETSEERWSRMRRWAVFNLKVAS